MRTYDGTADVLRDRTSSSIQPRRFPKEWSASRQARSSNDGIRTSACAAFWLDRFEVTNREFKAFVDAGGYANRDYWKEAFVENGRDAPVGRARWRVSAIGPGRPGPRTWELGYISAKAKPTSRSAASVGTKRRRLPRFAGKSLPTAYQWRLRRGLPRAERRLRRHPGEQQFQREGAGARSVPLNNIGPVRSIRHGRQRQGMVLERVTRRPDDSRRRLERARSTCTRIGTRSRRSAGAPRTACGWCKNIEPQPPSSYGVRAAARPGLCRRKADRRRGVSRSSQGPVRLRSAARSTPRLETERGRRRLASRNDHARRRVRQRTHHRSTSTCRSRRRRPIKRLSTSPAVTRSCCDRAAS